MEQKFYYENNSNLLRLYRLPSYSFSPHMHAEIEIIYCVSGKTILLVDDTSRALNSGDAAMIWPERIHSYSIERRGVNYIAIINKDLIKTHANAFANRDCREPYIKAEAVHKDVKICLDSLLEKPAPPVALASAYIDVIVGRLLGALEIVPANNPHRSDFARKVLMYISENCRNEITLESIARDLDVNKYQVSRLFSRKIGCNLCKYVNRLRVGMSVNLLRETSRSIAEIAEICGFSSERTFYRVFHEQRGISPQQCRLAPDYDANITPFLLPQQGNLYEEFNKHFADDARYSILHI